MRFADLWAFLRCLVPVGELRRARVDSDPTLEITAVATRVVKEAAQALPFLQIRGSAFSLTFNVSDSAHHIEPDLGRHSGEIGVQLARQVKGTNSPSWWSLWATGAAFGSYSAPGQLGSPRAKPGRVGNTQSQPSADPCPPSQ